MEYYVGQGFLNDVICEGDVFIILFEADGPVINNFGISVGRRSNKLPFFNPFSRTFIN